MRKHEKSESRQVHGFLSDDESSTVTSTGSSVSGNAATGSVLREDNGPGFVLNPSDIEMEDFPVSTIPAANVASIPQRSPLRYPGGKTWLIPHIRSWLSGRNRKKVLIEPFAGGGIVSLTAIMENLADRCIMAERDRDVSAFWHAALSNSQELIQNIFEFAPTRSNVMSLSSQTPKNVVQHGFRSLVLNRTRRGGVLAPGAALTRIGEAGKGVASRWYPETLAKRLEAIRAYKHRISFCETDGLKLLESILLCAPKGCAVFADPPYTGSGGKRAGSRLYLHNELDHEELFAVLGKSKVDF